MSSVPIDPHQREEQLLAPYAMPSRRSRGRDHPESDDTFRTVFQRDRDRVIHSTAFRRLEYKTQVFVNHEGDHYRTRLTHTLEVSQISRSVARALRLNEDLVEAIALSHDLGHAPFGHAGEEQLDELMRRWGGFNHNRHCLRVVEVLEQRYPGFPGLNLSWEVREAIVKHCGPDNNPSFQRFEPDWQPLLEAQLADIGDSLAYDSHDIDDGLRSGYLCVKDFRDVELWRTTEDAVRVKYRDLDERQLIARTVSAVIRGQVLDLVAESSRRLVAAEVSSVDEVRQYAEPLIAFSPEMAQRKADLQAFLRERLYRHYLTKRMSEKGKRFIAAIFAEYRREPSQLPDEYRLRVPADGVSGREQLLDEVICDYVAGMTDRFCQQEHMRLFSPFVDGGTV
ncbi:MAG: deoxyguanosinetriphosphate triphosphohydrolase [Planctomycetota bacterium]